MRAVRDDEGRTYLLVKRAAESSLVRDPRTGEESFLPNDRLTPTEESPLSAAARGVPEETRLVLRAARTETALGLLVELADRGPLGVRDLLGAYDLCESDLHGLLAELTIAGAIAETEVAGERGYRLTDDARRGLARLRG